MPIWNDVRLAARTLLRDRAFAVAALFALALGIAANATVFTIVNAVFFRDLPFADPDRIVAIETRRTGQGRETDNVSYPDLADLRSTARLFDGIAGVIPTTMNVADEEHGAERYSGAYISADAFDLLGHRPALGRNFQPADDQPGAAPVVILGYDIWQRRYAGAPTALGRMIRVNGVVATIIGVMPPAFAFPQVAALWLPLAQAAGPAMQQRDARTIEAFGRRRAGVTNEQAQADVERVLQGLARLYRPYGTDPLPFTTIIARAGQDIGAVVATLRAAVQTVDPNLPLFAASRLSDVVQDEFVIMRVIVSMLSVFAVAAVSLAAIGLYAVTAYAAWRRTREIGVRIALGARAADVWWLVTRRAATQLGLGLLLGLAGAGAIGVVLESVFSSVDGPHVPTLAAVAVLMLLVGFSATWNPAYRAMRTNPVDALRVE